MRKFIVIFRKILCLCNFHKLIQMSILRVMKSDFQLPLNGSLGIYLNQLSCLAFLLPLLPTSSLAFLKVNIPIPLSFLLCQSHAVGGGIVSTSGPVQQMTLCNLVVSGDAN